MREMGGEDYILEHIRRQPLGDAIEGVYFHPCADDEEFLWVVAIFVSDNPDPRQWSTIKARMAMSVLMQEDGGEDILQMVAVFIAMTIEDALAVMREGVPVEVEVAATIL